MVYHVDVCMVHMLLSPTPAEVNEFVNAHMRGTRSKDNVLIVVGCCSVEYSGRARSTLGWGERIVVVKPDGSVLVHQRAGREPVNWQPPGTRVRYQTETDNGTSLFVLYSYRFKPPEMMYVRFKNIETISTHRLRDDPALQITGAESDIADRIMSDPSVSEEGAHNRLKNIMFDERHTESEIYEILLLHLGAKGADAACPIAKATI